MICIIVKFSLAISLIMVNKSKTGTRRLVFKKRKGVIRSKDQVQVTPGESKPRPSSKSSLKTKLSPNLAHYSVGDDNLQYDIVNMTQIENVLSEIAVCKFCNGSLFLRRKPLAGLAAEFTFYCENSCRPIDSNRSFDNCTKITVQDNTLPRPSTSTENHRPNPVKALAKEELLQKCQRGKSQNGHSFYKLTFA